jgi:MYXO-CTERM domain-containing protein
MSRMLRAVALPVAMAMLIATARPAPGDDTGIPHSMGVAFQPGSTERIVLSTSFGLLLSSDGGETFGWVCSDAIGYTGDYHPVHAVSRDGVIFATSFDGLRVSRDGGCTWAPAEPPLGAATSVIRIAIGPDDRIWATTANGAAPNDVYVSDDGIAFRSAGLVEDGTWQSVLPALGGRIYAAGFRRSADGTPTVPLFTRSDDGATSWQPLPTGDLELEEDSPFFQLLGGSPDDPDLVFVRRIAANPPLGDAVYRSINGGLAWERVLDTSEPVTAFAFRGDGETVIVGTKYACAGEVTDAGPVAKGCVRISRDRGASFQRAASEPRMACLAERSDGMLFACGDNWDPDRFALGSSLDGETWSKVYRFVETDGPLECPAGSVQATRCEQALWPPLCEDLGICPTAEVGADAGNDGPDDRGACGCSAGGSPGPLGLLAIALLFRLRRRHSAIRDSAGASQRRMPFTALSERR